MGIMTVGTASTYLQLLTYLVKPGCMLRFITENYQLQPVLELFCLHIVRRKKFCFLSCKSVQFGLKMYVNC